VLIQFRGLVLPTDSAQSGSSIQDISDAIEAADPVVDPTGSTPSGSDSGGFGNFTGLLGD